MFAHPGSGNSRHVHSLGTDAEQSRDETEVAPPDEHVHAGDHHVEEAVCLCLAPRAVGPVRLGEEGRIGYGRWRRASNNIELRVGRDEEGEKGERLLRWKVAEEAREQALALGGVDQGYERVRVALTRQQQVLKRGR
jgi:hypothetical protein